VQGHGGRKRQESSRVGRRASAERRLDLGGRAPSPAQEACAGRSQVGRVCLGAVTVDGRAGSLPADELDRPSRGGDAAARPPIIDRCLNTEDDGRGTSIRARLDFDAQRAMSSARCRARVLPRWAFRRAASIRPSRAGGVHYRRRDQRHVRPPAQCLPSTPNAYPARSAPSARSGSRRRSSSALATATSVSHGSARYTPRSSGAPLRR
jgi:hypothetical protein